MKKRKENSKSFLANSKNLLTALIFIGAALVAYGQVQAAVVSHTPFEISGLFADATGKVPAKILPFLVNNNGEITAHNANSLGGLPSADYNNRLNTLETVTKAGAVSVQATRPACNVNNNIGQVVFVTAVDSAYFCSGGGWKSLEPTTDPDPDGDNVKSKAFGGTDCNDADATRWKLLTGYPDFDSDGYTLAGVSVCSGASLPSGYLAAASSPLDCNDLDATMFPGNNMPPMDQKDGKDNNCNGKIDELVVLKDDGTLVLDDGSSTTIQGYSAVFANPTRYMACSDANHPTANWNDYPLSIDTSFKDGVLMQGGALYAMEQWCKEKGYSDMGTYTIGKWPWPAQLNVYPFDKPLMASAYYDSGNGWFCGPSSYETQHPVSLGCRKFFYP